MCGVPTLQALADAFRVNKSVTEVDLSKNEFGDEGVKARALQWGVRLWGLWNNGTQKGDDCSAAEVLYEA